MKITCYHCSKEIDTTRTFYRLINVEKYCHLDCYYEILKIQKEIERWKEEKKIFIKLGWFISKEEREDNWKIISNTVGGFPSEEDVKRLEWIDKYGYIQLKEVYHFVETDVSYLDQLYPKKEISSTQTKRWEVEELNLEGKNIKGYLDLSEFWNLKILNCANNEITGVNLKKNHSLEILIIHSNYIQDDLNIFSHLINLRILDLNVKGRKYNDFSGSLKSLENCKNLIFLNIHSQDGVNDGLEYLPITSLAHFGCDNTVFKDWLKPFDYDIVAWKLLHFPSLISDNSREIRRRINDKYKETKQKLLDTSLSHFQIWRLKDKLKKLEGAGAKDEEEIVLPSYPLTSGEFNSLVKSENFPFSPSVLIEDDKVQKLLIDLLFNLNKLGSGEEDLEKKRIELGSMIYWVQNVYHFERHEVLFDELDEKTNIFLRVVDEYLEGEGKKKVKQQFEEMSGKRITGLDQLDSEVKKTRQATLEEITKLITKLSIEEKNEREKEKRIEKTEARKEKEKEKTYLEGGLNGWERIWKELLKLKSRNFESWIPVEFLEHGIQYTWNRRFLEKELKKEMVKQKLPERVPFIYKPTILPMENDWNEDWDWDRLRELSKNFRIKAKD